MKYVYLIILTMTTRPPNPLFNFHTLANITLVSHSPAWVIKSSNLTRKLTLHPHAKTMCFRTSSCQCVFANLNNQPQATYFRLAVCTSQPLFAWTPPCELHLSTSSPSHACFAFLPVKPSRFPYI